MIPEAIAQRSGKDISAKLIDGRSISLRSPTDRENRITFLSLRTGDKIIVSPSEDRSCYNLVTSFWNLHALEKEKVYQYLLGNSTTPKTEYDKMFIKEYQY